MEDRSSNPNLQDRTKRRSESMESISNQGSSSHGSIFDMSRVPDLIPEHNKPMAPNTCFFSGFLPKALIILNQLIVVVIFLSYMKAGNPATVKALSSYSDARGTLKAQLLVLRETINELRQTYQYYNEWRHYLTGNLQNGGSQEELHVICNVDSKIREAIELYDADKIGIIDYALESAGASIVSTPETTPIKSKYKYKLLKFFNYDPSSNPATIIQPGIMPGQCFGFEGHSGKVRIKLFKEINVTSVTLEHTHKLLSSDLSSAPKDFHVYGLLSADDPVGDKLGEFVYQIDGYQLQKFQVDNKAGRAYPFIELHIVNNYGHPEHTCVYRFRVHSTRIQ